jgi:hypothetical protein
VDYATYTAYIGDDNGAIHKITPVFNGTPAEVTTTGHTNTYPFVIDNSSTNLFPPLLDGSSANKNLYVTNTQGDVFEVQTAGTCTNGPPCLVASDTSTIDKGSSIGINDAPLFDVSASKL